MCPEAGFRILGHRDRSSPSATEAGCTDESSTHIPDAQTQTRCIYAVVAVCRLMELSHRRLILRRSCKDRGAVRAVCELEIVERPVSAITVSVEMSQTNGQRSTLMVAA